MHKHILITGSTDGIGNLTALKLAKEGHFMYLHGRNEAKLNAVVSKLKEVSKNPNIKGYVADFSDLNAVKIMAERVKNDIPKLDILINNAGIFKTKDTFAKNKLDYRIAVNYLAPFILTNALLSNLKNTESPRIINLSSAAQSAVKKGVLIGATAVNSSEAYAQSKLALTMWSFDLAKQEPNITIIAVNPGSLLNTKMANEAYGQHWSPAEKGVEILYALAMDSSHVDKSGHYFDNDKGIYRNAHPDAYDQLKIENLLESTKLILSDH